MTVVNHAAGVVFAFETADTAFPKVKHNHRPLGERVLVQVRKSISKTKGGVLIAEETRKTEHSNTQVGKLIAKGALAFCDRSTGKPWPEGEWVKLGEYVRIPKYGGDRFEVADPSGESVEFLICRDTDLLAAIDDPLAVRAFL